MSGRFKCRVDIWLSPAQLPHYNRLETKVTRRLATSPLPNINFIAPLGVVDADAAASVLEPLALSLALPLPLELTLAVVVTLSVTTTVPLPLPLPVIEPVPVSVALPSEVGVAPEAAVSVSDG